MTPSPVADIVGARVLAMVGDSVTTDHISPAGSIGPDTPAGRYLAEHGVARHRLQLLRGPPRQPRGDAAGHLRQRAPAQPTGPGYRGWVHAPPSRRDRDLDLRRRHAVRRGRRSPRRAGRSRVRHRVQPGLGGQGDRTPRRPGRHRPELRAHPPLEPDRHGGAAPAVLQGRLRRGRWGCAAPSASRSPEWSPSTAASCPRSSPWGPRPTRAPAPSSGPSSASTPPWRPSTTGTGGSSPTCSGNWRVDQIPPAVRGCGSPGRARHLPPRRGPPAAPWARAPLVTRSEMPAGSAIWLAWHSSAATLRSKVAVVSTAMLGRSQRHDPQLVDGLRLEPLVARSRGGRRDCGHRGRRRRPPLPRRPGGRGGWRI